MHLPAVMDGGPHQRIDPGAVWTASFPVLNRASTYWYHPHHHAPAGQGVIFDPTSTGYQVYEGLAGMIIVEDDVSDSLPLPRTYGVDDIPLIIQDRRFHDVVRCSGLSRLRIFTGIAGPGCPITPFGR